MLDSIRQDLILALRSFAKNRTFTLVAVLTLALGIGAAVTVFASAYGVLLHPLPVAHADRLVLVRKEQPQDGTLVPFGYADLRALRERPKGPDLAGFASIPVHSSQCRTGSPPASPAPPSSPARLCISLCKGCTWRG